MAHEDWKRTTSTDHPDFLTDLAHPTTTGGDPHTGDQQVIALRGLPPDTIAMHPRRWAWVLPASDTTDRPLVEIGGQGDLQAPDIANAVNQLSPGISRGCCRRRRTPRTRPPVGGGRAAFLDHAAGLRSAPDGGVTDAAEARERWAARLLDRRLEADREPGVILRLACLPY